MKRLFGAPKAVPKAGPAPSLSETSAKIDSRVQDLEAKIAKCDEDLRRHMAAAGRGSASTKQLALQVLKRKKMYEQQRDQILGTQFNVENLAMAQEQAEMSVAVVEGMKAGYQDLKNRYQQIGGSMDIERLMDQMADLNDEIGDINEALATSFAVPDGFDEASFEAELGALEEEMAMEKLAGASKPSYLPEAAPAAQMPVEPVPAPAVAAEPK
eukprot:TRINITY_DN93073_c0_g1_i1.p1 TRINITY_DN93073_c0_g1~~TRINITY_DN93073_c0_g1_i1.p1  ORF type:complete len:220 (+),score=62.91 TRINITY_DN93073_c0_g1_i1:24-662(+)